MGNFVALSEDLAERTVVQLEDEEPNLYNVLKMIRKTLDNIEDNTISEDKLNELFYKMTNGDKSDDTETKDDEENKDDTENTEENKDDTENKDDIEKAKDDHKPGDTCSVDGKKGKYVMVDDKLVCKELTTKELEEIAKTAYGACMSKEMKAGKSMSDAAKICKTKIKKEFDVEPPEEGSEDKSDTKSEETAKPEVDLADAEREYKEYLKQGKIVPAQKEAFIKLLTSGKILELGDDKVDITKLLENFMKSQPKIVNFEEDGTQGNEDDKKDDEQENKGDEEVEMTSEVKSFYQKMGLSDEAAKTSWKYAKDLKSDEDKDKESTVF